jgi:hypothetical protein
MTDSFPDNWTYLRTELNWLDRVLAGAIARQRKETKDVERVSKARIDQITSHWWKGIIQVEGTAAGDSPADLPRRSQTKGNYQHQMEARIQASQTQGIILGLPSLCQKLELSAFEKNAVLLALAPEVSRRYGRIYNFLQDTDHPGASGLPTIDLLLRLLCRNDSEWRTARLALSPHAKLLQHGVVVLPQTATESFLSHPVKLADAIAEYLLADAPQLATLEHLLTPSVAIAPMPSAPLLLPASWEPAQVQSSPVASLITHYSPAETDLWTKLILPKTLRADLHHLCDRVRQAPTIQATWANSADSNTSACGTMALLVGAAGTGKTLATQAIAQSLATDLTWVDLALVEPDDYVSLLQHLTQQAPSVLLVKSAQYWLGRTAQISTVALRQFLAARRQLPALTCLSVEPSCTVKASWQSWLTVTLKFSTPNKNQRLHLWQQAFPTAVPLAPELNWQALAQLPITGGTIQAIAWEAAIYAVAESGGGLPQPVTQRHIQQACQFLGLKC